MRMLPDVQQETIKPIIETIVKVGSLIHTDEYYICARPPAWGFAHETACHAEGEYARDDDGDGFYKVHVNTMEGCWSLLRSWLRPHRGISQENAPAISASSSPSMTCEKEAKHSSAPTRLAV